MRQEAGRRACFLSSVYNGRILYGFNGMIIFLHGEDEFSVNRRRRALGKVFAEKYPEAEIFTFDFEDQGLPEDVRRALGACEDGLFATRKMVVFLHPLELGELSEKLLLQFLQERRKLESETTLLFAHPGKIKKTHPVTSALLKLADKEEAFTKLDIKNQAAIRKLVEKEAAAFDLGIVFSRDALELFISSVGNDTARIVTELEKLSAYKMGGKIEAGDVALLLEDVQENVIFTALDALGRGDKKQALVLFHREAGKTEGAFPVLSMCAWQARRLLVIREAFDNGLRRAGDIARETKLAPFVVQKALGSIERFPMARIKGGLAMLSDFDTELKQGRMDPGVALDLFVWKF